MLFPHSIAVAAAIVVSHLGQGADASALAVRQNGVKMMIVGDSISHGAEGDYTWRYRIWQWLRTNNVNVDFVGPWTGTFEPPETPSGPVPPLLYGEVAPQTPDHVKGEYAKDIDASFDKDHFCHSGRQAAQVKNTIAQQIATYQPDYVLIALGFNDLGWWINGPDGLLSDMKTLIDNARGQKSNIKFLVADVPHRTRINNRQDLIDNTNDYNAKLASAAPGWGNSNSPVSVVGFNKNYNCGPESCPAAFDGLHPNKLGEYEIAQAFSRVLNKDFGFGSAALDVPANISPPSCPPPTGLKAVTAPYGVAVTWDRVFGARGYNIKSKRSSFGDWIETWYALQVNRYDQIWVLEGETWEYQVRTACGDKTHSEWTSIASAVVRQNVPQGPQNVVINPTADGFSARWDPPEGDYGVTLYEVFTYDVDEPCVFMLSRGIKGNGIDLRGLTPGHKHVIAISAWTDKGPGFPTVPFESMPGFGMPATPSNLKVVTRDPATVQLTFNGGAGSANYRTWFRNINNASDYFKPDLTVTNTPCIGITFLFPGAWNYEFCVTALNGNLETSRSNCVIASEDITAGVGDCPAAAQPDCGWYTPGNGGDGSGQPGVPGGGSPGNGEGGGGGGGGGGGNNDVYIDPGIWTSANPTITCQAPCDFILPPTVLPQPTTISFEPYTTTLEVVWTSNGQMTRTFQRTTLTLPPLTTQTISFWDQTYTSGDPTTFSPIPKIYPAPTIVTNSHDPTVRRTVTPSPYPTKIPEEDSDDDHYWGGPRPHINIHIGSPGPICRTGCGLPPVPCLINCGSSHGHGPCDPASTCPHGGDFQDPEDPDKENDDDDDDDDDDEDNDEDDIRLCPFKPLERLPAVNPRTMSPDEEVHVHYQYLYPGTHPDDQALPPPLGNAPKTLYILWESDNNVHKWHFTALKRTAQPSDGGICASKSMLICPNEQGEDRYNPDKCNQAGRGDPPTGSYTIYDPNRLAECVYQRDGGEGDQNNAGTLTCGEGDEREFVYCDWPQGREEDDFFVCTTEHAFGTKIVCDY